MKLKMIGTGAICSKERSACTLIDDHILIDCGNGIVKTLLEQDVDITKIDTLFITHLHGDHFLDIIFLMMQRGFMNAQNTLKVYGPKGTEKTVCSLFKVAYGTSDWNKKIEKGKMLFVEFDLEDEIKIKGSYNVKPVKVLHGSFELSYGLFFKNKDVKVFFSGDSAYCETVHDMVLKADAAVLDTTFLNGNEKHMGFDDIEKLLNETNAKIITTHIGTSAREKLMSNKNKNLIVPTDGDEINI